VKGRAQPGLSLFMTAVEGFGFSREWEIMAGMTAELPQDNETGQTILVVDDMSDNIILISLSLQDFGYRVVTATNGADALNVAKLARPDLILMDIAMPQQDGLAATRRIREESELQDVPVVALTAFDTDGFRQAAFDAGFNGYLTKPIDFDRLRNLITKLLARDKGNTSRL
jgi:CheY-like chemotaxis protein